MRLFFAVEISEALRADVEDLIGRLRARGRGIRWADPKGIHLTLRFLGEVEPGRLEAIARAGRAAGERSSALRLRSGGLGTFPERGLPRVVWLGVEDTDGALGRLHAALEEALEGAGLGREGRPLSPHLTLGRVRPGADPRRALEGVGGPAARGFEAGDFVLMESVLGPSGARYEARSRFALGGRA